MLSRLDASQVGLVLRDEVEVGRLDARVSHRHEQEYDICVRRQLGKEHRCAPSVAVFSGVFRSRRKRT